MSDRDELTILPLSSSIYPLFTNNDRRVGDIRQEIEYQVNDVSGTLELILLEVGRALCWRRHRTLRCDNLRSEPL